MVSLCNRLDAGNGGEYHRRSGVEAAPGNHRDRTVPGLELMGYVNVVVGGQLEPGNLCHRTFAEPMAAQVNLRYCRGRRTGCLRSGNGKNKVDEDVRHPTQLGKSGSNRR